MATTPHFDPGNVIATLLESVLSVAGKNFVPAFSSTDQPYDITEANDEALVNYQLPAGAEIPGTAFPGGGGNIGVVINSVISLLSPAINSYALIMPILGVIRGIIEIICALLNPFALVAAVIRLFVKWIPPFLSLFPPLAGVVILLSTIKLILAIVYYIIVEIVPTIQLIIANIQALAEALSSISDISQAKVIANQQKVKSVLKTLIQKCGIMAVLLPILELIFAILQLVAGIPCAGGEADTGLVDFNPPSQSDSTCCDEFCPEILSSRENAPSGLGVLLYSSFGDCAPLFVFNLITTNLDVIKLEPYQQNFQAQLQCQLDESVKEAIPAGSSGDLSMFKVKITSKRGNATSITVPVLDIQGTIMKIAHPLALSFVNQAVDYEVQPDYDMLVMHNVMGVGCHPDVKSVKDAMADRFPMTPVLQANPEAASLLDDYRSTLNSLNGFLAEADTTDIDTLNRVRDDMVDLLNGFAGRLLDMLNALLARNIKGSTFDIDKSTVIANGTDFATITVTPKDITGALIAKNLPNGASVRVEIINDFGVVSSQTFNNTQGTITAQISSSIVGIANISVRVSDQFVKDFTPTTESIRIQQVSFISEANLPTRRVRSKPSKGTVISTGRTVERAPRK